MSFFFNFMKKSKVSSVPKEKEEEKPNQKYLKPDSLVQINKFNITGIYNSNEDYKPIKTNLKSSEIILSKFEKLYKEEIINIEKLKKLSWDGIPQNFRHISWKILLSYIPTSRSIQPQIHQRKREEYSAFRKVYFPNNKFENIDESQMKILKIIQADVPRTQPEIKLFHIKQIQEMMVRLLFIWNLRHPASGYVQGINDLAIPFITAFLGSYLEINFENFEIPVDIEKLTQKEFDEIEADTYWCLCKILDYILDNYTQGQTGIQKALFTIQEICKKMDFELYNHLIEEGADFFQFAFKWVYCLLIREFPLKLGLILFDAYISLNNEGFMNFHIYVCAALILKWGIKIKKMNFNDLMCFLQNIPTKNWNENDMRMLLSEAFVYQNIFEESYAIKEKD